MADFNYHPLGSNDSAAKSAVVFKRVIQASHEEVSITVHMGIPVNCASPSTKSKGQHARKQQKEEFLNRHWSVQFGRAFPKHSSEVQS